MMLLYHDSLVLVRHEVVRLFERFGGFRFVPLCLLVSPIFVGFLSVLLSTLLSAFSSCLLNWGLFRLQMASRYSQVVCSFQAPVERLFFFQDVQGRCLYYSRQGHCLGRGEW